MALTAENFASFLKKLLPRGVVWNLESVSNISKTLLAAAEEFAKFDRRCDDFVNEIDPSTTNELLSDFERIYGLPDPCAGVDQSSAQRKASLLQKVISTGGQTKAYLIEVAASFGFVITITEFDPFTVGSTVDELIYGDDWQFAFQVNAPLNTVVDFLVTGDVADSLAEFGNDQLECVIDAIKPAHTVAIYAYA